MPTRPVVAGVLARIIRTLPPSEDAKLTADAIARTDLYCEVARRTKIELEKKSVSVVIVGDDGVMRPAGHHHPMTDVVYDDDDYDY